MKVEKKAEQPPTTEQDKERLAERAARAQIRKEDLVNKGIAVHVVEDGGQPGDDGEP